MSQIDSDDIPTNTSTNPHLNDIVAKARSRRRFMRRGLGLGAVGFFGSSLVACGDENRAPAVAGQAGASGIEEAAAAEAATRRGSTLGFEPVAANSLDRITVPAGYR